MAGCMRKFTSLLPLSLLLSGCMLTGQQQETREPLPEQRPTLASRQFAPVTLDHSPLEAGSLSQLRDGYADLLANVDEQATRKTVLQRLADLEMQLAEERQMLGETSTPRLYDEAIARYEHLLQDNLAGAEEAEVLYQLAKAYDLQGQADKSFRVLTQLLRDFADSAYTDEAWFRIGELHYSRGDYEAAVEAYEQVFATGESSEYYPMSAYMQGWARFKLEQFNHSLASFTRLLDVFLPNQVIAANMLSQLDSRAQLAGLPQGEKRLADDAVRVMAMLFSFTGADAAMAQHFSQHGGRHYENLLYDALGQQFLNDDRFVDSARVYRAFATAHPQHHEAPLFVVKQIDVFILGEFPSKILPAKQAFVASYGMEGPHWTSWGVSQQQRVSPYLHAYLQELARYEHSRAQLLVKRDTVDSRQTAEQAYAAAIDYYRAFIATFPHDDLTPQILFDLAESLNESGRYDEAVQAYETYAYQYLDEPNAAEAGYAAILMYPEILLTLKDAGLREQWQAKQMDSQARFVNRFTADSRRPDVLHDLMQQQFALQLFDAAMESAGQLSILTAISRQQREDAMLVMAHGHFARQQFAQAEESLQRILEVLPATDTRRGELKEKLAASMFRQAEVSQAGGDLSAAVDHFNRIIQQVPDAAIRVNAQYDAATALLNLSRWSEAIALLEDFRLRFAGHPLTANVSDKLIHAYQADEQWLLAARELEGVWQAQPKTQQGREALWVAAGYFEQAGERQASLKAYRSYAHAYPQPFNEATEARYTLSQYYLESGEYSKRRYWLKKLVDADAQAGSQRTERSRYLAAMASHVFAEDAFFHFSSLALTLPLKASLAKKRQALDSALKAYELTLNYRVTEFSTAANHRIAEIYHRLARDLMQSERPTGLSELEREQYDILLEEQAFPFEEQAITYYQDNTARSWEGTYDKWVQMSFAALAELLPGRFNKVEKIEENSHVID